MKKSTWQEEKYTKHIARLILEEIKRICAKEEVEEGALHIKRLTGKIALVL